MVRAIFSFVAFFMIAPAAYSLCETYPDISTEQEFSESRFVLVATVSSRMIVVDPANDPEGYAAEIFSLDVEQAIKGLPAGNISLMNGNDSGRFPLEVGARYLLFVRFDGDFNWISSCGNSGLLTEKSDVLSNVQRLGL